MKWALVAALLAASLSADFVPPRVIAKVASPDGRTVIEIRRWSTGHADAYGALVYHVTRDGHDVLLDSPLGIRRADQNFDAATLTLVGGTDVRTIDEYYTMPFGKRRQHHVIAHERTIHFKNPAGAMLDIVLRAHDDGVAFRYRFPETSGASVKKVLSEATGFHVPANSKAWMLPQQEVGKYAPAYEDFFREVPAGTSADRPDGWSFPALFRTPDNRWLLITESALSDEYCGSHLTPDARGGVYGIKFPDPQEGLGVGDVEPRWTLPWTMPWRVVIVGDQAGRIAESDFVLDLAPPASFAPTDWVKTGRASWSWWSNSDSPKHAEQLNAFTDLAAEMGWEYALVDANWNAMESGTIEEVVAHAKTKHIGLFFWYNSGGAHNDVTEGPRDRMTTRRQRVKEFAQLKAWGAKGVKVDFWQSDKQDRIQQYRDLLRDAASFDLMVNFHGSTIPRGWSREFPNLIGMEAVFGAEQYKFRDFYPAKAPWHNTVLPFTRNAIGPMDFTPVTFSDAKYPHVTTNAHELALSVIFENGVQHFADSVEAYRKLPEPVKTFLKQVPSAWDDTRVLVGEPGRFVVMARRDRDVWYMAGINGEDVPARFSTLSLPVAGDWHGTLIGDGATGHEFTMRAVDMALGRPLDVAMRANGGFVVRLERR